MAANWATAATTVKTCPQAVHPPVVRHGRREHHAQAGCVHGDADSGSGIARRSDDQRDHRRYRDDQADRADAATPHGSVDVPQTSRRCGRRRRCEHAGRRAPSAGGAARLSASVPSPACSRLISSIETPAGDAAGVRTTLDCWSEPLPGDRLLPAGDRRSLRGISAAPLPAPTSSMSPRSSNVRDQQPTPSLEPADRSPPNVAGSRRRGLTTSSTHDVAVIGTLSRASVSSRSSPS
jgi:hypothetical protein